MMMKDRLFSDWTGRRIFYLVAGIGLVVISAMDAQWAGVLMGGYFASMGLFAFGCAGGSCFGGSCDSDHNQKAIDKVNEA